LGGGAAAEHGDEWAERCAYHAGDGDFAAGVAGIISGGAAAIAGDEADDCGGDD